MIEKLGEPIWYDENGTPRYCEFNPQYCYPYARVVAFFEIQCSHCEKIFKVATSTDLLNEYDKDFNIERLKSIINNPQVINKVNDLYEVIDQYPELSLFDYGDPPFHWKDKNLNEPCMGYASSSFTTKILAVYEWNLNKDLKWIKLNEKEISIDF